MYHEPGLLVQLQPLVLRVSDGASEEERLAPLPDPDELFRLAGLARQLCRLPNKSHWWRFYKDYSRAFIILRLPPRLVWAAWPGARLSCCGGLEISGTNSSSESLYLPIRIGMKLCRR